MPRAAGQVDAAVGAAASAVAVAAMPAMVVAIRAAVRGVAPAAHATPTANALVGRSDRGPLHRRLKPVKLGLTIPYTGGG